MDQSINESIPSIDSLSTKNGRRVCLEKAGNETAQVDFSRASGDKTEGFEKACLVAKDPCVGISRTLS